MATAVERRGGECERARRLVVYATEEDRVGKEPLWSWLVEQARELGLAGATVWRGVDGLGRSGRLRSDRFPDADDGFPMVVEVVDAAERIGRLLEELVAVEPDVLATLEEVDLYRPEAPSHPLDESGDH
ncbi:DUF190 domain-containing protein [Aciditerrimonas ferrireducens]|jgi:PII-like signaling protein|uniref:DUF190 domain-containing protein n=1 Tax=Aciditerrimonas ferrireducens TaxID=667306 RepID=UPI002004C014|nr:DUF190 domain-containing protein [Aciditerrimonas ferrireducens]MCK4176673.1 DUF190 domain-containing protein [Aciditerrimonas ferrireducens]